MAPTTSSKVVVDEADEVTTIKSLVDNQLNSVPSEFTYVKNPNEQQGDASAPEHSIPTVDFAQLTSTSPEIQSEAISELGKACREWGFFKLINHGVPQTLMKSMIDACNKFFELPEEEKKEFQSKNLCQPIKCGTSFNVAIDKVRFWRDYLKVVSHPEFHALRKPAEYNDVSFEFSKQTRKVATKLLSGISESLGLEAGYIAKIANWDKGFQLLAANYYPVCRQPELAIGLPPHTDHGLVTLLIQNDVGGLEVEHNGQWIHVDYDPGCYIVNVGDQMQVLTNDKYKSVLHRAVVNNRATRISIVVPHGPALDSVVFPIPELLDGEAPKYIRMSFDKFTELKTSPASYMVPVLDHLRVKFE